MVEFQSQMPWGSKSRNLSVGRALYRSAEADMLKIQFSTASLTRSTQIWPEKPTADQPRWKTPWPQVLSKISVVSYVFFSF